MNENVIISVGCIVSLLVLVRRKKNQLIQKNKLIKKDIKKKKITDKSVNYIKPQWLMKILRLKEHPMKN